MELLCKDERVDWNTRDVAGNTPLLFCLKGNQLEMARLLLSTPRVDLHVKDGDGKYPEMIARSVSLCYCYSCRLCVKCVMCISIFVLCREMNQREILDLMRLQAKMSIVPGKKIVLPTPKLLGSLLYA